MSSEKTQSGIEMTTGSGGEPQQRGGEPLTTNHGVPIPDNQNSLKSGERGPTLLEDFVLREKIFHFDHERIPERIVHARGTGAHGYFECTDPIPELTMAQPFQKKGMKVPVFVRFSTVAGSKGSKDTPRDVRGFAVKFYTEDGNWDLVGNNIPVFFIQDAMKFPDLIHSVKPESDRGFPQAASAHDTFWDFISLSPESMHMMMWLMSDRAIPRSFRMMDGFGVHTFRFVNASGEATFVKFHWRAKLRAQSVLWDEAVKISGADPDYNRRDLFEAITMGDCPEWELGVQVFDEDWAAEQPYDVLDATKLVPEEDIPLRIVGRMVLDRYPDNFFAETEQVAFLPSNVIPGIDFTEDPLLQGRLFSYLDTQKSRLGTTNFHQIPVNAPKCPMHNFQRDGMMQTYVHTGRANYEPNSLYKAGEETGPRPADHHFATYPDAEDHGPKRRLRAETFADHYSQARQFYRSQTPPEQDHIVAAITFELSKVDLDHVRVQALSHLRNVDEDMAARIAKGIGIDLPDAATPAKAPFDAQISDALSIHKTATDEPMGRMVGVLVTDGTEDAQVEAIRSAAEAAGVRVQIVAEKRGGVTLESGTHLMADGQLAGTPSVMFDAVAILPSEEGAKDLAKLAPAKDFAADAFAHLKAIVVSAPAKALLEAVDAEPDDFVFMAEDDPAACVEHAHERLWSREAMVNPAP
ncbi:catalase [Celeribacter indicus]|uniref:Catalase n=1 Tax=Celeribacter indicus TaxID=1208324 RepID=A0A0B5E638_9RHOB|nr:catalase [Celeribacter indicus]AJE48875.1 catalase [Celeribacter indicus]SDW39891.1 catalase [Celeribacter indicus]